MIKSPLVNDDLLYNMVNFGIDYIKLYRDGSLEDILWDENYETYEYFVDQFDDYWERNYGVDESVFNETKKYLEDLMATVTYYEYGGVVYIQLHDHRTFWDIESEVDPEEVYATLDEFIERFELQTGQEAYFLGNSGRHVCVDFTLDNLENYESLKETALDLEKEFIDTVNSYGE